MLGQALLLRVKLHQLIAEHERGFAGPHLLVGLDEGRVPDGEDGVADQFDDGAIGLMNALQRSLEVFVQKA